MYLFDLCYSNSCSHSVTPGQRTDCRMLSKNVFRFHFPSDGVASGFFLAHIVWHCTRAPHRENKESGPSRMHPSGFSSILKLACNFGFPHGLFRKIPSTSVLGSQTSNNI